MSKTVTLKPRLNEKTYGLAASRVYVFDVERSVNKHSIARAVESQFEVKVAEVNTANIAGKPKRVVSLSGKRVRSLDGSRGDFKKAYVTLAKGHGLPFFEAIEEEEQKEQATQEKFDKAAAKQAEKDEKTASKAAKAADKTAKTDKKPAKTEKAAKPEKPESKAKPAVADKPDKPAEPAEQPPEEPDKPHRRLSAWRGFRLRKKSKNKEDKQ